MAQASSKVDVEVRGEFGAEGEGAREITYSAPVAAQANQESITSLMKSVVYRFDNT